MKSRVLKYPVLAALFVLLMSTSTMAQEPPSFSQVTAATEELTSKYVQLYYDLDFDELAPLIHPESSFNDPTANMIFGSKEVTGKVQMLEYFRSGYASIKEMELEKIRSFVSGDTAVYESVITWTFTVQNDKEITIRDMPLVLIVTVADGLVISHRDFGDYQVFVEQYREQMK